MPKTKSLGLIMNSVLKRVNSIKHAKSYMTSLSTEMPFLSICLSVKHTTKNLKRAEHLHKIGLRDELNALNTNEPRKLWQFIKKMRSWGTGNDSDDEIQPSKWTSYFRVYLVLIMITAGLIYLIMATVKILSLINLTFLFKCEKISKAIKCLKTSKAAGFDNILNESLISGKESLLQPCIIFYRIFTSHTYPSMWSINFLRPVHKRDDRKNPDNYRGIAVGSCVGKLFSYVLLNRFELPGVPEKR